MSQADTEKLRKFIAGIDPEKPIVLPDVVNVMRLMRMIIESDNSGEKYKTLNLFCHLLLHSSMDRNTEGLLTLERLNTALLDHRESYDISNALNFALGLKYLRHDFINFCTEKNVNIAAPFYRSSWIALVKCILDDISGREVKFPDDIEIRKDSTREKKIFNRMSLTTSNVYPKVIIPVSFRLECDLSYPTPSLIPGLYWVVKCQYVPSVDPTTNSVIQAFTLVMGIGLMEPREAFVGDLPHLPKI